jgi:S-adenosylmethionine:tRNA ribosyltransferase-isomerase
LVVSPEGELSDLSSFEALPDLLTSKDILIFNDSRVIPARLIGSFPAGTEGNGEVELLLTTNLGDDSWRCLGRPMRRFRPGTVLEFGSDLRATILERVGETEVAVRFSFATPQSGSVADALTRFGGMPIPPYIRGGRGDEQDKLDYQSHFAKEDGSIAAPTASLHFTPELMQTIAARGVQFAHVTLHVGAASIFTLERQGNTPGREQLRFNRSVLDRIQQAKDRGGRCIAVGTTVVRALESMAVQLEADPSLSDGAPLTTELFIKPGSALRVVDAVITNFHQPGTSHLLLVERLVSRPVLEAVYAHAMNNGYRFLSYGDGMFVTRVSDC